VPRRYLIRTFGCQMNEHDSERIAGLLEADGLTATDRIEDADVVVLNTCCIRENADNKLYGNLGQLKSVKDRRPDLQIAVGGCLAQKDRGLIQERAPWVDAVFGTHNVAHATDLLRKASDDGPVMEILEQAQLDDDTAFPSALPVRRDQNHTAWVTIQIGCDNHCAFCIVPAVRGKEISRPFGDIVADVERLAGAGTVEVTLLGQNVNSYGRDLTSGLRTQTDWRYHTRITGAAWAASDRPRPRPLFADLLRAVGNVDGIRRVRYTSPHPKDLRPETIEVMATEPAVCEHLHLPLQAGSDRTLAAMHRGYTAERYLERLAAARAAVPDLAVTTDLIVGFPGETEADFERTLEVVAEAQYDSAYTFIFSPRPGTEAAARTDEFVPPDVAADRFGRLKIVVERSALAKHEARVGRIEEVLVEGPSKRDQSVTSGRTRQNKLTHFRSTTTPLPAGTFADVRITKAAPHFLTGELVEVTSRPRHKTRIPVVAI
jgi:tRNA-2-methylthio-N6-dimethylallyladenosine synthase